MPHKTVLEDIFVGRVAERNAFDATLDELSDGVPRGSGIASGGGSRFVVRLPVGAGASFDPQPARTA